MNTKETKEAITFLGNTLYMCIRGEDDVFGYKTKYNHWIRKVIDLLQRGEKYEAMWEELDTIYITGNIPRVPNEELGIMFGAQKYIMKIIKQKYFPKLVKKEEDE